MSSWRNFDGSMNNRISRILFFLLLGAVGLLRIWLTEYQPLLALGWVTTDDQLFIVLAKYLLKGEWLGPYNSLTLVKGPFFSMWIAFMYVLGIPLLLSAQILYIASCLVFVYAVKPLLTGRKLLAFLLFFSLLFNPASFDAGQTRVLRDLIYPSLTLLLVACAFGVFFSTYSNSKGVWLWGVGLGIIFGCFWITREEGIWVVPFLVFVFVCAIFLFYRNEGTRSWRSFAKPWLVFILCFAVIINSVSYLNYIHYGVYVKTDLEADSYKAAYGALTRVKPSETIRYVPVTKKTRMRIYKVSPAFRELKGYLEGPMGDLWAWSANGAGRNRDNRNEILGGWFQWAFRDAVSYAGYYSSGKYPDEYYQRVANEINAACDTGLLDCYPRRDSLIPIWHRYYIKYLIPSIFDRMAALIKFEYISIDPIQSIGTEEQIALFKEVTREQVWSPGTNLELSRSDGIRLSLARGILRLYQVLMPWLGIYSIVAYLILLYQFIRRRKYFISVIVLSSLLILTFTRVASLAFLDATSWKLAILAYLHPAHVIWLAFVFLAMVESFGIVRSCCRAKHSSFP